ncbi:hypothetical protein COU01_02955 [Candidatus Falkowbacteria bacterium CG10_big_fil_rev_8_21_14_0_10_44_15]|uniref:Restriction system protein Mrr-like N-terminal domain-containing protein n=1 Tax=Candidatus Falkowbacteria bacterium CG10_big_fil_rev_8_21_14_0_10_44_15 TaxID=1974569 RepID=A0A2H0UZH8_9BACT|nr:MAG: hypothetical protein COU01_02955 [Candidatus Falkowbacteria bacterium CG10_big_fil_rev_8_21_14_0_10_44_15]
MKWVYIPLLVLIAVLLVWLVKNWRQTIFRKRVVQALQNFQQATQAEIENYFRGQKWPTPPPKKFGTRLAIMEERGLLSWHRGKKIVFKLTEAGMELLPKPKAETPTVTPTFAAKEFQRKPK